MIILKKIAFQNSHFHIFSLMTSLVIISIKQLLNDESYHLEEN